MTLVLADFPPGFLQVCALLNGLIWGSFLNVVIHRLPRGMSLARPASHCPACKAPIEIHRNIPVISWLLLRGKAACCGAKVSARYPAVELIGGVLSLAVLNARVLPMGDMTPAVQGLALYIADFSLLLGLTAAAFIDLELMVIPDSITFGGTILGLGTFAMRGMTLLDAAIGAAVGFALVWLIAVGYSKLRGVAAMGLGDAKLTMLAGAWLGWEGTAFVLGAGAIQGSIIAIAMTLLGHKIKEPDAVIAEREELRKRMPTMNEKERAEAEKLLAEDPLGDEPQEGWGMQRIAFGPFLILATIECLLIGPQRIFSWIV